MTAEQKTLVDGDHEGNLEPGTLTSLFSSGLELLDENDVPVAEKVSVTDLTADRAKVIAQIQNQQIMNKLVRTLSL